MSFLPENVPAEAAAEKWQHNPDKGRPLKCKFYPHAQTHLGFVTRQMLGKYMLMHNRPETAPVSDVCAEVQAEVSA